MACLTDAEQSIWSDEVPMPNDATLVPENATPVPEDATPVPEDATPWSDADRKFFQPSSPKKTLLALGFPIPKFPKSEVKTFFTNFLAMMAYAVVFVSPIRRQVLKDFVKSTPCFFYLDRNCGQKAIYNGLNGAEAVQLTRVYLFHNHLKCLLSTIGNYCHTFLGGYPLTPVRSILELFASDRFMAFGFEPRDPPDSDAPQPEPFYMLDLSNLGPLVQYIKENFSQTFVAVVFVGSGSTKKFMLLRMYAKTSIYHKPGETNKYLIMACNEYDEMLMAIQALQRVYKDHPIEEKAHFGQLKTEGSFVVGGFINLRTVSLFTARVAKPPAAAAPVVKMLAAAPQVVPTDSMANYPPLPVQTEQMHDIALTFTHILGEFKKFNPSKAAKIEADAKTTDDPSYMEHWCGKMRTFVERIKAADADLE